MSNSLCRVWRVAFLACAISLTGILTCNTDCLAKKRAALPTHKNKAQSKHKKKYDQTALQLQQMQKVLNAYSQRLQEMQSTINTLKAQVGKTQSIALTNTNNQKKVETKLAVDTSLITLHNDQDIGNQLIFGSEEEASNSSKPLKEVSAITGRVQSDTENVDKPKEIPRRTGQSFNPDITVSGIFSGNYADRSDIPDRNRFRLNEAEFGFSSAIDPYSRGTVIFSKPDNGSLDVEEGYVTLLNLPFGLQSKIGKFRNDFGKLNMIHSHDLPQADTPDVLTNFFGEEGLNETGLNVSKILPTPWYSDINLEIGNGDTQPLFGNGSLTKPLVLGHWKNFINLSENKSLEVGLSNVLGSRDIGLDRNRLSAVQGLDLTYNWIPSDQAHTLKWQTEFLAAELEQGNPVIQDTTGNKNAYFGGYSFLEYKINNRWSVGTRVDYSQVPLVANASEWAVAPYVNYSLSEFGKIRLECKHTFANNFESSNRAWLQYVVIMGTHPPHTL